MLLKEIKLRSQSYVNGILIVYVMGALTWKDGSQQRFAPYAIRQHMQIHKNSFTGKVVYKMDTTLVDHHIQIARY